MKKWITLLLCGLLCLCVAGAMAEGAVTLDLSGKCVYEIYPDGYRKGTRYGGFDGFVEYNKGKYIVTGTSYQVDTCLDFYSKPKQSGSPVQPVTYEVVFQDVEITADMWSTAIRFGQDESTVGAEITLNLINSGNNSISGLNNHMVFENASGTIVEGRPRDPLYNVTVNIHNTLGSSLYLQSKEGLAGVEDDPGRGVNLFEDGSTTEISPSSKDLTIRAYHCSNRLVEHPAVDATESKEGNIRHWVCSKCGAYFLDKEATQLTMPDKVRIPMIKRPQTPEMNDLPQTGDSSHLLRWMAVLLGACFGVIAVRSRRKV